LVEDTAFPRSGSGKIQRHEIESLGAASRPRRSGAAVLACWPTSVHAACGATVHKRRSTLQLEEL